MYVFILDIQTWCDHPNRRSPVDQYEERGSIVEVLQAYIGGQWTESATGARFTAYNPATGEAIATLPECNREDARRAIAAANAAKARIARMTAWERSRLCLRIADELERRREEVARVITLDQGKPYHSEALGEVTAAIHGFREAAEHIKWLETAVIPVEDPHKRVLTFRQPRGVYAVITPWNFPVNIPVEYLAAGLAAGNAFVWVPAPTTSVAAVKLMECIVAAEVPAGVVNLVTGPGPVVGDEIVAHPDTDAVGFTGSSATGEAVARRAAGKPLLLELGGNGPTIVLPDAGLERAAAGAAFAALFNAGQCCSATERILVHESVHDQFLELLVQEARKVRLGNPLDAATTMGPLNNQPVAAKMDRHLADARERGAEVLVGGGRAPGLPSDLFYLPTVVDRVPPGSLLDREESFGPVAAVTTFRTEAEALELANAGTLGLLASVYTRDISRAFFFAEQLRTGIVNVNDHSDYWELHIPFGGVSGKRSGIGRLGGKNTILEMTDLRTVTIDIRR